MECYQPPAPPSRPWILFAVGLAFGVAVLAAGMGAYVVVWAALKG